MSKNIDFNKYNNILVAECVTIHDLLEHFKKEQLDYDEHGNVFVNFNKENKGSPILVAHMDNVLHGAREPVMSVDGRYIMGRSTGIGFDDKAGIIANIELFNRMKGKIRLVFTTDEEIGGVSASKLDPSRIKDAKFMIELDRRGHNDLIQHSGCTRLCSDKFASLIEAYGFKKNTGTFTDVNQFKKMCPEIEMCNLSIGYYNAHSDKEYLDIKEFNDIVDKVERILNNLKGNYIDDTKEEIESYEDVHSNMYGRNYDGFDFCENCGAYIKNGEGYLTLAGYKCCCKECADALDEYLCNECDDDDDDLK